MVQRNVQNIVHLLIFCMIEDMIFAQRFFIKPVRLLSTSLVNRLLNFAVATLNCLMSKSALLAPRNFVIRNGRKFDKENPALRERPL